ncbi:MAG: hypothetical protein V1734_01880 [Nanoarchaeota archaeon]
MGEVIELFQGLVDRVDEMHAELKQLRNSSESFNDIFPRVQTYLLRWEKLQKKIGEPETWPEDHPTYHQRSDLYFTINAVVCYWKSEAYTNGRRSYLW